MQILVSLCVESSRFEEFSSNFLECVFLKCMLNTSLYLSLSSTDSSSEWSIDICTRHREGPWQAGEMGRQDPREVHKRQIQTPAAGEEYPYKTAQAGDLPPENTFTEKGLGALVSNLNLSQQCTLAGQKANSTLASRSGKGVFSLCSALVRPPVKCSVQSLALQNTKGPLRQVKASSIWHTRRCWEGCDCLASSTEGSGWPYPCA